ncbi:hypothetical protein DFH06DRAFT_1133884 [Mycena polygramma]|nr:hypothetical protein DFH06DRAFT_1133884 [Mycena polygramma]
MRSLTLLSAALLFGLALAKVLPVSPVEVCEGQVTLSETYIGKDKNVLVQYVTCPKFGSKVKTLVGRQEDVCGAPCTTYCFSPAGGGPVTNDCHIIADALRYNSQNIGKHIPHCINYIELISLQRRSSLLERQGTNNTVAVKYASCLSFFVNQHASPLEYCNTEWADVIDWVAPNCASAQKAHGGLCLATNQEWFIQVNHS